MRLALFTLASLSIILCDYQKVPEERIFSLDNKQDLNEFDVKEGDEFFIKIHGNPTTGYAWYLNENSNRDNLLALNLNENNSSTNYETDPHESGMVGVGGNYYFKFKGLKTGQYNLLFVQKRAWENYNIAERFVLLNVK